MQAKKYDKNGKKIELSNNKKYKIEVEEILQRVVEVEAESESEAIKQIQEMYNNEIIVLDSEDWKETNIDILEGLENE